MKRKLVMLCLMLGAGVMLSASNLQADFFLCQDGTPCNGTDNGDVMMGSPGNDNILGNDGDDVIFGLDNPLFFCSTMANAPSGPFVFGVTRCQPSPELELLQGENGNDFISGGPGLDHLLGGPGNDVMLPNSDLPGYSQLAFGNSGNDTIYVMAGEIAGCLFILGGTGFDVVGLIGFGPYSALVPFGLDVVPIGWIHVVDPIAGGDIFIRVVEGGDLEVEVIHGLLSPNVTYIQGESPPPSDKCISPAA